MIVGVPVVALMNEPTSVAIPAVNVTAALTANVISLDCSIVGAASEQNPVALTTVGNAYT